MLKEYIAYGHTIGCPDITPEKIGKVYANNSREALKIARLSTLMSTIDKVVLQGTINPDYSPEKALIAAIWNETYNIPRLINRR